MFMEEGDHGRPRDLDARVRCEGVGKGWTYHGVRVFPVIDRVREPGDAELEFPLCRFDIKGVLFIPRIYSIACSPISLVIP